MAIVSYGATEASRLERARRPASSAAAVCFIFTALPLFCVCCVEHANKSSIFLPFCCGLPEPIALYEFAHPTHAGWQSRLSQHWVYLPWALWLRFVSSPCTLLRLFQWSPFPSTRRMALHNTLPLSTTRSGALATRIALRREQTGH